MKSKIESKKAKTINKTLPRKSIRKSKKRLSYKISKKRLSIMLNVCPALINRTGEFFKLTHDSKNIFTITSIQSGKSLIYYKKDATFSEGLVKLWCGIDACQDYYKMLTPIQSIH